MKLRLHICGALPWELILAVGKIVHSIFWYDIPLQCYQCDSAIDGIDTCDDRLTSALPNEIIISSAWSLCSLGVPLLFDKPTFWDFHCYRTAGSLTWVTHSPLLRSVPSSTIPITDETQFLFLQSRWQSSQFSAQGGVSYLPLRGIHGLLYCWE